jgi:hypothetical protein
MTKTKTKKLSISYDNKKKSLKYFSSQKGGGTYHINIINIKKIERK